MLNFCVVGTFCTFTYECVDNDNNFRTHTTGHVMIFQQTCTSSITFNRDADLSHTTGHVMIFQQTCTSSVTFNRNADLSQSMLLMTSMFRRYVAGVYMYLDYIP